MAAAARRGGAAGAWGCGPGHASCAGRGEERMSGRGNPARQVLGVVGLLLALAALAGGSLRPAQAGPAYIPTPTDSQHTRERPLHNPLNRVAGDILQQLNLTG